MSRCDIAIPKHVGTAGAIDVPGISLFVGLVAVPVVPVALLRPVAAVFLVVASELCHLA